MLNLPRRLQELEKVHEPIQVAIVGIGHMGSGVTRMVTRSPGMRACALADNSPERAKVLLGELGIDPGSIYVSTAGDPAPYNQALEKGMCVVTNRAAVLPLLEQPEVVVEATGVPRVGAALAWSAIRNGKHVVSMNIEADATVGHLLADCARSAGVVYTVGAGDEPGAIKELCDFATSLGLKIVAAGKGKNNPLDRHATPSSVRRLAEEKGISARMMTEFVDGSKTMMEMTTVANATGLVPEVRGMHGPAAMLAELSSVFSLQEKGGILGREGVVDYAIGDIAPGVFVVFNTDDAALARDLDYIGMGPGPGYLLYRPYHLISMEIPISIARAVLDEEPTIVSCRQPVAETIAVAKRDLRAGARLDGIGGLDVYGLIDTAAVVKDEGLLPLGLVEGAIMRGEIRKDAPIRWEQVEIEQPNMLFNLRLLQDQMQA